MDKERDSNDQDREPDKRQSKQQRIAPHDAAWATSGGNC
jgi:hypothetical protein